MVQAAALEEILITPELKTRPHRRPNAHRENIALLDLARVMVNSPGDLTGALLQMAMELCKAGTAGLSILEKTASGEQVFRCTNLFGRLSKNVGGSTPRHSSPCGITLDRDAPQLFKYPGDYFPYLNTINMPIVEALVIPIFMGVERPGTLWVVSFDEKIQFDSEDVRIMTVLSEFTACALRLTDSSEADRTAQRKGVEEIATRRATETALRLNQSIMEIDLDVRAAQLQQLSVSLMNLQDEERRRLARELHDSAGQYLAAIQMNLSSLQKSPALLGSDKLKVVDAIELAEQCITEIRTISYLLHPPLLDELGLTSALSMYVEGFAKRSEIGVELEIPSSVGRLPGGIETALFRVVQQSLANIHKHSGSSRASISVSSDTEHVVLKIRDYGCGIPAATLQGISSGGSQPGVGLTGMRERITAMGGDFGIESSDNGTMIEVRIPLGAVN